MEEVSAIEFTACASPALSFLDSRDARDALAQWNLDKTLHISKHAFATAGLSRDSDERLLKDFIRYVVDARIVEVTGSIAIPMKIEYDIVTSNVMDMGFFDKLKENGIVEKSGTIRGCYEEQFDDILVSDKLREMLLNDESENANVYSAAEKNELIYRIMQLLVLGGTLNQMDTNMDRYLALTKSMYKEMVTVFRDSESGEVLTANRCYAIRVVDGTEWHANRESKANCLLVNVDRTKKFVTLVKHSFVSFW